MLSFIALLPGIIAYRVLSKRGIQFAFLRVYMPVFLLMPEYYHCVFPGAPDPSFSQSACVVLIIGFVRSGWPGYRFSFNDLWVYGYALCASVSEYRATNYADAQNLMFGMIVGGIFPYIFAKSLIEPFGNRFEFAKICVLSMCIVAIINIWETRFGFNVWRFTIDRFFPGQGQAWVTTFRFGLARAAGPYAHALLAGVMMIICFRLQRWLHWSDAWPRKIKGMKWLPYTPAFWLSLIAAGGLFLTLAKGSWLASFVGATITAMGRFKNRKQFGMAILFSLIAIGVPAAGKFISYASVGRSAAADANQETAAYRYELIANYMDIANEKPLLGWGLSAWPKIPGTESIDNHYLLLYLMHGRLTILCFFMLLFGTLVRLIRYAFSQPPAQGPLGSSLAFTLAGIYVAYIIAIATVYMGFQTFTMFMMLCGWSESYMQRRSREWQPPDDDGSAPPPIDSRPFKFQKVL